MAVGPALRMAISSARGPAFCVCLLEYVLLASSEQGSELELEFGACNLVSVRGGSLVDLLLREAMFGLAGFDDRGRDKCRLKSPSYIP